MRGPALAHPSPYVPMARWRKLALSVEILVTYATARWELRRHPLPATLERLRRVTPHPSPSPLADDLDIHVGARLGLAVMRVLRLLPTDSRCLMRSLVLTRVLSRRGLGSVLVIGVRPGDDFFGHAWVERRGTALLPPERADFARLVEL